MDESNVVSHDVDSAVRYGVDSNNATVSSRVELVNGSDVDSAVVKKKVE